MPKRFFDTELWRKEWYRKLTPAEKSAWAYLLSHCDNVGVIRVDQELAQYCIGGEVDWQALLGKVNGNLEVLPDGKFWVVDFCEFQYGELQENCKPHVSYIILLKKYGLLSRFLKTNKGYGYPINRVQDKIRKGPRTRQEQEQEEHTLSQPFAELNSKLGIDPKTLGIAQEQEADPDAF